MTHPAGRFRCQRPISEQSCVGSGSHSPLALGLPTLPTERAVRMFPDSAGGALRWHRGAFPGRDCRGEGSSTMDSEGRDPATRTSASDVRGCAGRSVLLDL